MCDVDDEAVVSAADAPSIYDIPKVLHSEGLDAYVVRRLGLPFRDVDWTDWDELLRRVHRPARTVTIALVGKYVDLPDAYLSVTEALRAGGFANDARVNIRWVTSDDCETPEGAARRLDGVDGVADPRRVRRPRHRGQDRRGPATPATHGIPLLGLCLGLQCMVIEVAPRRSPAWPTRTARSSTRTPRTRSSPPWTTSEDVVAGERDMGGTMRLGLYPAVLAEGSIVRELYGHRPGAGAAPAPVRGQQRLPRARSTRAGLVFSGTLAGRAAGRVRRAAAQRPPVLRGHPGAPGAPVPADPAAPAVQRAWSAAALVRPAAVGLAVRPTAGRPPGRGQRLAPRLTGDGMAAAGPAHGGACRRGPVAAPAGSTSEYWPVPLGVNWPAAR